MENRPPDQKPDQVSISHKNLPPTYCLLIYRFMVLSKCSRYWLLRLSSVWRWGGLESECSCVTFAQWSRCH